uniref:Uncharacterized protein n=1 Tax=Solanum lycopersicum TaxID=4081 RepID=A0A3Q7GJH5_SOLLC
MANKLYFDELVVSKFDIHAKGFLSQAYSRISVLFSILRDGIGESPSLVKLSMDVLADQLCKWI